MIVGKLIGGALGYLIGGGSIFLAILGVVIGHVFDAGYKRAQLFLRPSPEQLKKLQDSFFTTVFSLLGHLAKADGRISQAEVSQTESFMSQMGLTPEHRQEAIRLFKLGAAADFSADACIADFRRVCGMHPNLVQMLMVYLVNVALADGNIDSAEEAVLRKVAEGLRIPAAVFEQMLRMIKAQDAFSSSSGYSSQGSSSGPFTAPRPDQIELAYQALGVNRDATDAQLKRAYRKLMSQYHPDKLTGQGLPDDMIKAATERSQEIQAAYDVIKKTRGKI